MGSRGRTGCAGRIGRNPWQR